MSIIYDVVIVGSGPGGASAAKELSQSGLRTLIIEKLSLPRYKMCSGIIFPAALKFIQDNFGEIPKNTFCKPFEIKGIRAFIDIKSSCIDVPFKLLTSEPNLPENGLNVNRDDFDYWLCKESNAEIRDKCMLIDFTKENNNLILYVRQNNKQLKIETKYLIGADGANSKVRRILSPHFERGLRQIPNYEVWYHGKVDLEPGWLYIFSDRSLTGYIATLFHKDDKIIVATGVAKGESVVKYHKTFTDYLKQYHNLEINKQIGRNGCVINDMSASENYFLGQENILIVGEAAGFLRSAEGIAPALITGKEAGKAIINSIETDDIPIHFYSKFVQKEKRICRKTHKFNERTAGYNFFLRD